MKECSTLDSNNILIILGLILLIYIFTRNDIPQETCLNMMKTNIEYNSIPKKEIIVDAGTSVGGTSAHSGAIHAKAIERSKNPIDLLESYMRSP